MDGGIKRSENIFNEIMEKKNISFVNFMSYELLGFNLNVATDLWRKLVIYFENTWKIGLESTSLTIFVLKLEKN